MTLSDDPRAELQQAALHERSGRLSEAIADYERVLKRWPALPNSWYNLALLQRRIGSYAAALESYRQALAQGVSQPEEVHLNRGVIYADCLRQADNAERELAAALALNPSYGPALLNLANLNEDRGRREQALALYEQLLAIDPACHEGRARHAALRGVTQPADPLIAGLRHAIGQAGTSAADQASLGFALGKVLDECGAYDQAFSAYSAANEHSRASVDSTGPLYDPAAHERYIGQLIDAFSSAGGHTALNTGTPPLFICGMFRSGSTLAEQVLAGHSCVQAGGEISFMPNLVQTRLAPYPASLALTSPDELAEIAGQYRHTLARLAPGARHVTDKRPDNFLHIGFIKRLFPDAKIVHTTRSPLDNALSIFFLHLDQGMAYALSLSDIGHYYCQYRRLMAHWKTLYGHDILDFDYDAFVREPRPAVEKLLNFCGLDWEEGCMAFERVSNSVRTASVWQVRQPLYRHASGRWQHYERHLGPLRDMLGDIVGSGTV